MVSMMVKPLAGRRLCRGGLISYCGLFALLSLISLAGSATVDLGKAGNKQPGLNFRLALGSAQISASTPDVFSRAYSEGPQRVGEKQNGYDRMVKISQQSALLEASYGKMTDLADDRLLKTPAHIRLTLEFSPHRFTIRQIGIGTGGLPESVLLDGEFLYAIHRGTEVLYAGSFSNPLARAQFPRDISHAQPSLARSGQIVVTLPEWVLNLTHQQDIASSGVDEVSLKIYRSGLNMSTLTIRDIDSVASILARSERVGHELSLTHALDSLTEHRSEDGEIKGVLNL